MQHCLCSVGLIQCKIFLITPSTLFIEVAVGFHERLIDRNVLLALVGRLLNFSIKDGFCCIYDVVSVNLAKEVIKISVRNVTLVFLVHIQKLTFKYLTYQLTFFQGTNLLLKN